MLSTYLINLKNAKRAIDSASMKCVGKSQTALKSIAFFSEWFYIGQVAMARGNVRTEKRIPSHGDGEEPGSGKDASSFL
jgi:hypothetical protein